MNDFVFRFFGGGGGRERCENVGIVERDESGVD